MRGAMALNLRRFRKVRQLTQQALADAAGISRVAYRNIETGASEAKASTLNALAQALRVSVFDLLEEAPTMQSLRFRSLKSLTAQERAERDQIAVEVARWLRDYNELEDMLDQRIAYRLDEIDARGSSPEEVAATAREHLSSPGGPTRPDICGLLEQAGVKVRLSPSRMRAFFGLSVGPPDGGPAIAVNTAEEIPVERQIFTAAHELGHLLLHGDSYRTDRVDEDPLQEKEANRFAAHFLMPPGEFSAEWEKNRGLHWIDAVLRTKRQFGVSYKTVLRRLVEGGLADDRIYPHFVDAYATRYGKRLAYREEPEAPVTVTKGEEPVALEWVDFHEDRLSQLVHDALDKGLISIGRAAEILNVSLAMMRERISEWGLFGCPILKQ
ncbi:ImmA/IrrE family metallo-endopeptidase [Candidatus Fermentibacteria bacterium]|nr:ImmA/IrrE family metallo-endopeptidase [Candidatus Fermentibacteria bacterium]